MNYPVFRAILFFCLVSCTSRQEKKEVVLYEMYCASCHIAPSPEALPQHIWEQNILPEMGARLGIREDGFDPYKDLSMDEHYAVIQTGVYPSKPLLKAEDWALLKEYILRMAPDTLRVPDPIRSAGELEQFSLKPVVLDSIPGSMITALRWNPAEKAIVFGDFSGKVSSYDPESGNLSSLGRYGRGITDYCRAGETGYITSVGYLDPSEIPVGRIFMVEGDSISQLPDLLHRPVHTTVHDFDQNGTLEIVVCEFGDLKGALSLYERGPEGNYQRRILLQQPGSIRTVVRDLDRDGLDDILLLSSQGDEGVTVLYQRKPLQFEAEKLIRFAPEYGSSWFEVVDYEGDGDLDIITIHGDNADKSFVLKPYHGLRIHLNEGDEGFREAFFLPFHGGTRVIASDFDADGDTDFCLLSTFPDYSNQPLQSFTYLDNRDEASFDFQPYFLTDTESGRWFLMDSADFDNDGDEDIVLSSFTYYFSPVPESYKSIWARSSSDLLLLHNNLYNLDE